MRPITPCGLTYPLSSKLEGFFLANLGQGTKVSVCYDSLPNQQ
jgi:hypothetical protein